MKAHEVDEVKYSESVSASRATQDCVTRPMTSTKRSLGNYASGPHESLADKLAIIHWI